MGKEFDTIDEGMRRWIERQRMFFVATAPLDGDGRVNLSPKGMSGTFKVLARDRVAYLDLAGSGVETIAHLRENGRIVIMMCAFEGPPKIVRLHGKGTPWPRGTREFDELRAHMGDSATSDAGVRSIIDVRVERVSDSCGYGVPLMAYEGERPHYDLWVDKKMRKGPDGIVDYVRANNAMSVDGLPGIEVTT